MSKNAPFGVSLLGVDLCQVPELTVIFVHAWPAVLRSQNRICVSHKAHIRNRLISKDVAVFAPRCHHRWLSAELGCQPSAIRLFRLLPLVSGTICHSTSRLQNLCLSSSVASRLISLSAAFCHILTVVVPEMWPSHCRHVNRSCYVLTLVCSCTRLILNK